MFISVVIIDPNFVLPNNSSDYLIINLCGYLSSSRSGITLYQVGHHRNEILCQCCCNGLAAASNGSKSISKKCYNIYPWVDHCKHNPKLSKSTLITLQCCVILATCYFIRIAAIMVFIYPGFRNTGSLDKGKAFQSCYSA